MTAEVVIRKRVRSSGVEGKPGSDNFSIQLGNNRIGLVVARPDSGRHRTRGTEVRIEIAAPSPDRRGKKYDQSTRTERRREV